MRKKTRLFPILALLIPIFALFAPVNTVFTTKVCAGNVVDQGINCIDNETVCPTGTTLARDFFRSVNLKDVTSTQVSNAFAEVFPDGLRTMCMNSSVTSIIPLYMSSGDVGGQNVGRISEAGNLQGSTRIPRACPPGWQPSQSQNTLETLGVDFTGWRKPWGCCPSGYRFVNTINQSSIAAFQVGACVKNSIDASYLATEGGAAGNGIYDASGNRVIAFDANANFEQFPSWSALTAAIGSVDYIYSYRNSAGVIAQPVLGQGFGPEMLDLNLDGQPPRVRTGPTPTGARQICPTNTACAIVGTSADMSTVVDAQSFEAAGNSSQCFRCYTAGDTIGTSTPPDGVVSSNPDVDASIGFVRYCNADGTVKDETLLGTPDITRGYLLEDAANQALYKQCFDTGGIYTAIGCVDPTPTGIITGLIRIALGIMGGVALLQMIYVGILYQQGNTEKIKGARTQLIATITGIAVLVFSVLILRIIGVNILDTVSNGTV